MGRQSDEESLSGSNAEALSLKEGRQDSGAFGPLALTLQLCLAIAFCFSDYDLDAHSVFESIAMSDIYRGMSVMALAGFGFLYTFLKAYGIGAITTSLMIYALGMQFALLLQQTMSSGSVHNLSFDFEHFLSSMFGVFTALIGYGALLGKTSPLQVLFFTPMIIAAAAANQVYYLHGFLKVYDYCGTLSMHVFGSIFGLAASYAMGGSNNEVLAEGSRMSETIALFGSCLIGIMWPSLNAAALAAGGLAERSCMINTIIAVAGSGVTAFSWSALFGPERPFNAGCKGGRLLPHVVGSARLAGGVAIGGVAGIPLGIGPALLIGNLAGIISAWGFLKQFVPMRYDTCGVTNLHLLPGLLGAVTSAIVPLFVSGTVILPDNQIFGLMGTVIFASFSGAFAGLFIKCLGVPLVAYNDEVFIDVAHNELVDESEESFWGRMNPCVTRDHEREGLRATWTEAGH